MVKGRITSASSRVHRTFTSIVASKRPAAYTHILPAALKAHPRNKSDEEIRFIVEHGGFVGVTMFPPFLARGNKSSVEDYITAIDYVIGIAGEDNIGIGTDFTQVLVPAPLNLSIRAVLTRWVPK